MDNIHVSMENILEENIQELSELSTFKSRKATIYFTLLTFLRYCMHIHKMYSLWKGDICFPLYFNEIIIQPVIEYSQNSSKDAYGRILLIS